jgi:hypothetical protein
MMITIAPGGTGRPALENKGKTRDRLFLSGQKSIFPGASTSKNLIAFESVSTPLGREPAGVGLVGDGGG